MSGGWNCRDGAGGVEPVAVEEEEATSESEVEPTAEEASAAAQAAHEQFLHHLAAARAAREQWRRFGSEARAAAERERLDHRVGTCRPQPVSGGGGELGQQCA